MGLYRCLFNYVSRPDDHPSESVRKQLVLVLSFFPMPLLIFTWLEHWIGDSTMVGNTGRTLGLLLNVASFGFLMITKTTPLWVPETMMIVGALCVVFLDWEAAAEPSGGTRLWPIFVLAVDVLLLVNGRRRVQYIVVTASVIWLIMCAIEDGYRLGLYDIDGWSDWDSTAPTCSSPPCAKGSADAVTLAAFYLCVFFIDYMATRSFAEGQRRERDRVMYMMTMAEQVAGCLVRFDLESAETVLAEAADGSVSGDLNVSFTKLLRNLARYRPYLPQTCFEDNEDLVQPEQERSCDDMIREALPTPKAGHPPCSPVSHAGRPGSVAGVEEDERQHKARLSRCSSPSSQLTELSGSPRMVHAPQQRQVTMVCTNYRGFHAVASRERVGVLSARISAAVTAFNEAVQMQNGVLDLISGDHFSATFGALRSLGAHRQSATRCAYTFSAGPGATTSPLASSTDRYRIGGGLEDGTSLAITTAVCSGLAVCGDYGTSSVMRFMVLGVVNSLCRIAERAAAGWNTAVLVDGAVHCDITLHWNCRLRHKLHHCIGPSPASTSFWEVMYERHCRTHNQEWMYALASVEANPWEDYSRILTDWCIGETSDLLAKVSVLIEGCADSNVRAALTAVGEALSVGQPPPVTTLAVGKSHPLGNPGPVRDTACASHHPQ